MTHYETLEISRHASPEVVRAAYRSLMQRFHPDRHPGDAAAAARAAAITGAYEVLSDAQRREAYDEALAAGAVPPVRAAAGPAMARARGAAPAPRRRTPWWAWSLLVVPVVWGAVWLAGQQADPARELAAIRQAFADPAATEARRRELHARKAALLQRHPSLQPLAADEARRDLEARSLDLAEAPIVVALDKDAGTVTLPRLQVVAGSFDAPSLLEHIRGHRERLLQEATLRVAAAEPARLADAQGEAYLRSLVVEGMVAGLGVRAEEVYPSTYFESPGRHGVVAVVLPDGFRLQLSSLR